jgi:hypothetical protein
MKHQRKPNRWSCAITALAMTLDIPVLEIVRGLGHDGGEVIFPHLKEPACRKGFHSQELVRIAWQHGFAMTPIELFPHLRASDSSMTHPAWLGGEHAHWSLFIAMARMSIGIVEGQGSFCRHSVHNDHGTLYDPDSSGDIYELCPTACKEHNFRPDRMWVFTRYN